MKAALLELLTRLTIVLCLLFLVIVGGICGVLISSYSTSYHQRLTALESMNGQQQKHIENINKIIFGNIGGN